MNINTFITFQNYSDWVAFLKFLEKNDIVTVEDLIDRDIINDYDIEREDYDQLDLPPIDEAFINKRNIEIGTYYIWIEKGWDRAGDYGFFIVKKVPDKIKAKNYIKKAQELIDARNYNSLEDIGIS